MATQVLTCPSTDSFCKYYAFSGFRTPSNKYASIAFCDWDCCIISDGLTGESVDGGSLGIIYQPTSWPSSECTIGNPTGKVDGHVIFEAINGCSAMVTKSTGLYEGAFPVSAIYNILNINQLVNNWGGGIEITTSDYLGYGRGFRQQGCGQNPDGPDQLCFPIFAFDPSPNNT